MSKNNDDWKKDPSNRRSAHWHDAYLSEHAKVEVLETIKDRVMKKMVQFHEDERYGRLYTWGGEEVMWLTEYFIKGGHFNDDDKHCPLNDVIDAMKDRCDRLETELKKTKELRGLEFEQLITASGRIAELEGELEKCKKYSNKQFDGTQKLTNRIIELGIEIQKDNAEEIIEKIKRYGICIIDNGANGGLCIGKNCNGEWIRCESRHVVSLQKYLLDIGDDKNE